MASTYEDQNGYLRFAIEKNKKHLAPVHSFHYLVDGHSMLRKLIREFHLCPRLCFMQSSNEPCGQECLGACDQREKPETYNKRVEEAMQALSSKPSFAIVDNGLNGDDRSCILVLNGKLYGMGYIPSDTPISDAETLKDHLQPYKENSFIRNLLHGFAARYPSKLVMLTNSFMTTSTENFQQPAFH